MAEANPDPNDPELEITPGTAGGRMGRARARPSILGRVETGARAKSYTEKPHFGAARKIEKGYRRKTRSRWFLVALVTATIAVSGLIVKQESLPHWMQRPWSTTQQRQVLTLTAADIDYAATATARESLARGEIPPVLAQADAETRRKILSGEQNLYTKRLLESHQRGILVHARVSTGGTFLGEDLLTAERPQGTTFPAGPGTPTHFHFTVEQAGPNGVVSCYVNSVNGAAVSTRPLATGESADLEVITR